MLSLKGMKKKMERATKNLVAFLGGEAQSVRKDIVAIKGQLVILSGMSVAQQKLQGLEEALQKINQVQMEFDKRIRLLQEKLFSSKSSLASLKS